MARPAAAQAQLGALKHARRATPHVIRHTTAMHLLQVGADLSTIASWLGNYGETLGLAPESW